MLRFTFLFLAVLLGSTGWLTRRPASPTDSLPPVAYAAFEINPPTAHAGQLLAQAARQWPGVNASTFNESSGLMVLIHTPETNSGDLRNRLEELSSGPVLPKQFARAAGPQCPVPHDLLQWIPALCLGGSALCTVLFALFFRKGHWRKAAV